MHFGIFPFLRRSQSQTVFPPIQSAAPAAPAEEMAPPSDLTTPAASGATVVEEPAIPLPQAFHSSGYVYRLTLPPGWQPVLAQSTAGSPPIDRFSAPDGLRLGIWNEACPLRSLAGVPAAERAGALALADGTRVQFAAFAPSTTDGSQFLEGRWLAHGKRWTVSVQVASAAQRERLFAPLAQVLATFAYDG